MGRQGGIGIGFCFVLYFLVWNGQRTKLLRGRTEYGGAWIERIRYSQSIEDRHKSNLDKCVFHNLLNAIAIALQLFEVQYALEEDAVLSFLPSQKRDRGKRSEPAAKPNPLW